MYKVAEELTLDLIKFRSTESNKEEKKGVIEYIINYFKQYPEVKIKEYPYKESPFILVATEIKDTYDIVYSMHLDVVDGHNKQFQPYIKEGKIFGRGSADMKGPAASVIKAYEKLLGIGKASSVGLIFTTDEETGSLESRALLSHIRASCAIIPDNRCLSFDHIVNEAKGFAKIKIYTKGIAGHGSRPWEGENAFESLMQDLFAIRNLFEHDKDSWKPTLNIGKVYSGEAFNKIPHYAEAWLDIRSTHEAPLEKLLEQIYQVISSSTIEVHLKEPPVYTSQSDLYLQGMITAMKEVLHTDIPIKREEGNSDARFFSENNISTFLCKPLSFDAHGDTESISIKSMKEYTTIFTNFNEKHIS